MGTYSTLQSFKHCQECTAPATMTGVARHALGCPNAERQAQIIYHSETVRSTLHVYFNLYALCLTAARNARLHENAITIVCVATGELLAKGGRVKIGWGWGV